MKDEAITELFAFIKSGTSPYHVVDCCSRKLKQAGFLELDLKDAWQLHQGGAYFVKVYGSTLIAFRLGEEDGPLHLATAHTDFPCLRVKPLAEVPVRGYGKVNVEIYGGMIRESWLDRPLSLAGKVVLKTEDPYAPNTRLVDLQRPVMTIPRLAIHMNRAVNKGVELNPQKDMLPLMTMLGDNLDEKYVLSCLAEAAGCPKEEILSYDLTVYPWEEPCLLGARNEFLSSPRLDNLTSVKACLTGMLNGTGKNGLSVIALFDNEEVGSRTKQGAASQILPMILKRIYSKMDPSGELYERKLAGGFFLSLDVAHAFHPNYPEKNDVTNFPVLNGGVTLKMACSQSYAGDAEAIGIVSALCAKHQIPYQYYVNRSDIPGGSTLGSILSAQLPIRTMDIGVPILAMHSARETMGAADQTAIEQLMNVYLGCEE